MAQSYEKKTVVERAEEVAINIFEGDTSTIEYQAFLQLLISNLIESER